MRANCIAGADAFLLGAFVAEIGVGNDAFHIFRVVFAKRCPIGIFLEFLRPFRELDASVVPDNSLLREFVGYKGLGKSFLNH